MLNWFESENVKHWIVSIVTLKRFKVWSIYILEHLKIEEKFSLKNLKQEKFLVRRLIWLDLGLMVQCF